MGTCTECHEKPDKPCENALADPSIDDEEDHKPITVHDHEYNEWYCKTCWDDYSDDQRGLEWYNVVEESNGETENEPGAESEGATR